MARQRIKAFIETVKHGGKHYLVTVSEARCGWLVSVVWENIVEKGDAESGPLGLEDRSACLGCTLVPVPAMGGRPTEEQVKHALEAVLEDVGDEGLRLMWEEQHPFHVTG